MKRLDLGILGGALLTLMLVVGCNDDNHRDLIEPGEVLVVSEQVVMECDQPFTFKAGGKFIDTNVSVEYNGTKETYNEDWGIDVGYVVITPCIPCEENNVTTTVIDPTKPIDGNCGCGYELNDCGTLCVESQGTLCGEGTELNATSGACEVIPPLKCGIGLIEVEGACVAKVYKLEDDECIEGYVEGSKGYFCFLESAIDKPSPK